MAMQIYKAKIDPGPGAKRFAAWARVNSHSLRAVSKKIGDRGCQVQRWTSGNRESLSLRLLCKLSVLSGIPIQRLCTRKQASLIRDLVEIAG